MIQYLHLQVAVLQAVLQLPPKLASNTLKGDKLPTAVGKSKGAAIGAAAGALGDALDKLLPSEITNTFINDASGEIDIAALDGMDATSPLILILRRLKNLYKQEVQWLN